MRRTVAAPACLTERPTPDAPTRQVSRTDASLGAGAWDDRLVLELAGRSEAVEDLTDLR
jgi:hypothetical protein